ncbi:MAG: U32 family peptidase [Mycoplasmoidaceae bacterium]|nr:U32 family peptidase [Mycoplasmoidaceae bacterium]
MNEQTRQLPNVIIEDNTGTHMFTGYNVSVLEYFDQMIDLGIDSINIFSFLHDRK